MSNSPTERHRGEAEEAAQGEAEGSARGVADPRDEAMAKAREALKAFLHLVTPGPNDDGLGGLEGLPDSFQFELVWAPNADVKNAPKEQFQDPTITAGQIRRACSALAALDAAKGAG